MRELVWGKATQPRTEAGLAVLSEYRFSCWASAGGVAQPLRADGEADTLRGAARRGLQEKTFQPFFKTDYMLKTANTEFPVLDLIRERWSARSFSGVPIASADLFTLFEAASWAASAMNEQPWRYYYAHRGTEAFTELWQCLMPGNQPWTQQAAVLMAAVAETHYQADGKPNPTALHDVGMANAHMMLQAVSMHIYGHMMGGFDAQKVRAYLSLPEDGSLKPVCIIALGYLAEPEKLPEPFKTRELTPRKRNQIQLFSKDLGA